jgi:hypothetical protein
LLPAANNFLLPTKRPSRFCLSKRQAPFAIKKRWRNHLVGKKLPFASTQLNEIFYRIIVLRTLVQFKDFDTPMVANAV